jgi:hypothetical protein
MLVIGSTALVLHGFKRAPKDLDIIGTFDEYNQFVRDNKDSIISVEPKDDKAMIIFRKNAGPVEFELAWEGTTGAELLDYCGARDVQAFASLDVLYTLKMSHRYLKNSPHFNKTMDDIFAMRKAGAQIPFSLDDWYQRRMKETYDYKHPSLKQTRKTFFADDNINYIYVHDTIHEAVKQFGRPAYEYFKDDKAEVFCSKQKFMECAYELKLASVLEETYVLALERSQIPFDFKPTAETSFKTALMKVCTSITSGWWREWAWEHYYEAVDKYDPNYVDKFKKALADGIVRPMPKEAA